MTKPAKIYIGLVLLAGTFCLEFAIRQWQCPDTARYMIFAALALLAGCFKVRLPGMRGTISISFVMVLIGTAEFGFSQTVITAGAVGIVQSVWRCKRPPQLVQAAFNAAVLAVSAAAAYQSASALRARLGNTDVAIGITTAGCVYFLLNTFMVSSVLALLQSQNLIALWKNCHLWSFPYYLVGAAIAAVSSGSARSAGWPASLLVLPVMIMAYMCYRTYIEKFVPAPAKVTVP